MLEDKLTKQQNKLYNKIVKDYGVSYKEIKEVIDEDADGNIKASKGDNKKIALIMGALWLKNAVGTEKSSSNIIQTTRLYYDFIDKSLDDDIIGKLDLDKIVTKQLSVRNKKIGFKKLINVNAKNSIINVNKLIRAGVKGQKTPAQVEKEIKKYLQGNGGKALSIARTETNTHKSLAKLDAGNLSTKRGNLMKKTWIYTGASSDPRPSHQAMDGETVVGVDTYFSIGTVAPQQFGDPSEDINCTCSYVVEYITPLDFETDEFKEYVKNN